VTHSAHYNRVQYPTSTANQGTHPTIWLKINAIESLGLLLLSKYSTSEDVGTVYGIIPFTRNIISYFANAEILFYMV